MFDTIVAGFFCFISTFTGGLTSIRFRHRFDIILGFTAGVIIGLVAFDIFPEIFKLINQTHLDSVYPMIALITGLLLLHLAEKTLLIHQAQEGSYKEHKHPSVGVLSALALIGHSFLDGVGIGIGFQISHAIGIVVAIAVIGHDFADGLNTGSLMLVHRNSTRKTILMITLDALAPVVGVVSTFFFHFPSHWLLIYLGFFAGTLLYISLGDILPEAHSKDPSFKTMAMTILGIAFIFLLTRFI